MLILSRKKNQDIFIKPPGGPEIKITVIQIDYAQNRVRLGFEADKSVVIHRGEVVARIAEKLAVAEDRAFNHIDIRNTVPAPLRRKHHL